MGEFKYDNLRECERDGGHLAKPPYWPPRSIDGSMSLRCEECGAWLTLYKDQEPKDGTRVVMPS